MPTSCTLPALKGLVGSSIAFQGSTFLGLQVPISSRAAGIPTRGVSCSSHGQHPLALTLSRDLSQQPFGPTHTLGWLHSYRQGVFTFGRGPSQRRLELVLTRYSALVALCRGHTLPCPFVAARCACTSARPCRFAVAVRRAQRRRSGHLGAAPRLRARGLSRHGAVSIPRPSSLSTQVSNASGSAVAALSATPMSSMLAVSLAGASTAFTADGTPLGLCASLRRQRSRVRQPL